MTLLNYHLIFNKKKATLSNMIITTTDELTQLCARLSHVPFITLDTEFIREKTYYPELCLIQIAGPDCEACIDPLSSELDMTPLFGLLQNPKVVKVFHAARQDIEIFYHLTGQVPTPLFDTQIAAMVCGYGDNVGYQQLVSDICRVTLDKSMRVTDWSRRPLTPDQEKYALHDVTYLRDIYQTFSKRLTETGRQSWLSEEIAIQNNPATYDTDDNEVWRRIKVPFKKPLQTHVFARLCAWREQTAKSKNRPRKFILKDEALIELAILMPMNPDDMDRTRTLSKGFGNSSMGQEILHVIKQARSDSPDLYPQNWTPSTPLTSTQRTLADLLQLLLHLVAAELGVAPKIIASVEELHNIARGQLDTPCMTGWRRDVFGEKVLLLKSGQLSFSYNPKKHKPEIQVHLVS